MMHSIGVSIDERNGLMAALHCVDHDAIGCGVKEVFEWDVASALESYHGKPIEFEAFDIRVLSADEEGFSFELATPKSNDSGAVS
jgi:hypothetical protein